MMKVCVRCDFIFHRAVITNLQLSDKVVALFVAQAGSYFAPFLPISARNKLYYFLAVKLLSVSGLDLEQ
jgi:hypothetical protein